MKNRKKYSKSITDLLIATLCSARNTRRFKTILFERKFKQYKKESIRVSLSRLSKKEYICNSTLGWSITEKGKKYNNNINLFDYIRTPLNKNLPRNTIISFDIPESKRKIRNWLRNQIKIFGYEMLQQSLWLGPGPLPSVFLKRLEELNIKIFSVKKT